jgi:hypothetical protein
MDGFTSIGDDGGLERLTPGLYSADWMLKLEAMAMAWGVRGGGPRRDMTIDHESGPNRYQHQTLQAPIGIAQVQA